MLQRILGVVLVVAGLGAIVFGVATATVLRESDSVVATAEPSGDGTMVVTDPGVLGLVDQDVTVTASVPAGQAVTVVVGRDVDVLGWIGEEDPYSRVTGLADWETLATEEVVPEPPEEDAEESESSEESEEPAPPPDPAGSDMWITELTDAEQVTLRWADRPGRWVLLAAGTGAAPVEESEDAEEPADEPEPVVAEAPSLALTWDREVSTPLLWPAVGSGTVLLLIGAVLLINGRRRRKRARRAAAAAEAAAMSSPQDGSPSAASPSAASPSGASPQDAPSSPDAGSGGAGSAGTSGTPWAPVASTGAGPSDGRGAWPPAAAGSAAAAGAAATSDEPAAPGEEPPPATEGGTGEDGSSAESASSTAPVPVAGRFRRRSRRRRAADDAPASPADDATTSDATTSSGEPPVPQSAIPAPQADEPPTTTAGSPTLPDGRPLTRRELRRREEERRAAEPSGVGRAFRALTGQTPVVPPASQEGPAATAAEAEQRASRRASAWRETWGFGGAGGSTDSGSHDDTTDGGTR